MSNERREFSRIPLSFPVRIRAHSENAARVDPVPDPTASPQPNYPTAALRRGMEGVQITSAAFASTIPGSPLAVAFADSPSSIGSTCGFEQHEGRVRARKRDK